MSGINPNGSLTRGLNLNDHFKGIGGPGWEKYILDPGLTEGVLCNHLCQWSVVRSPSVVRL